MIPFHSLRFRRRPWAIASLWVLLSSSLLGLQWAPRWPATPPASALIAALPATLPAPTPLAFSTMQAIHRPNAAIAEPTWWSRSDAALTLNVMTQSIFPSRPWHPILTLPPHEPVWITLEYARRHPFARPTAAVHWVVNSPDGVFTTPTTTEMVLEPAPTGITAHPIANTLFQATQPGIYTIQAVWRGHWSVPLVLTVGASHLAPAARPWTPPPMAATGVIPLAPAQIATDPLAPIAPTLSGPHAFAHIQVHQPIHGWIPLTGSVTPSAMMPTARPTITLQCIQTSGNGPVHLWDYTIPLTATDTFAVAIRPPWHGSMTLAAIIRLNVIFTRATLPSSWPVDGLTAWQATVDDPAPSVSQTTLHTLASGELPLNQRQALTPYAEQAWTLLANAPTEQAGVLAIANWVSARTTYDWAEYRSGIIPWGTATQTLHDRLGVCENEALALTILYRLVGLPARLVTGVVRSSIQTPWTHGQAHAWTQVFLNGHWLTIDPTWDGEGATSPFLTNTYARGQTLLFQTTHHASTIAYGINP